jgi:LPXTG-motif cell wall-anchored protein
LPIVRRALTVAAVTAASTVAFAIPAWAHTPDFTASCDEVTIHLSQFSTTGPNGATNTVHVLRNGQELAAPLSPVTFGRETTITVPETWDEDTVTYRVQWSAGELSDNFTAYGKYYFEDTLTKPGDCAQVPPTSEAPSPAPTETTAPTETPKAPSTSPAVAPATTAPAPSPSATAEVQGSRLANTGAGNTVPLAVVGSALLAAGVGLTLFTRRRRRTSRAVS